MNIQIEPLLKTSIKWNQYIEGWENLHGALGHHEANFGSTVMEYYGMKSRGNILNTTQQLWA